MVKTQIVQGDVLNNDIIPEIGLTRAEVTKRLSEPFPAEAIKQRPKPGGSGHLDYVDTMTVINRLIYATNNTFDISVERETFIEDTMLVYVSLTIPGLGTRTHVGVQRLRDSKGRYLSEDMFKGAASDGIKKAASLFGVAKELYGPDYEQIGRQAIIEADQKAKLASLLKKAGVTKLSQVNEQSITKYGVDFNNLDEEATKEWLAEMEKSEPVPF